MQKLFEKTRDLPFDIMGISTGEDKSTVEKFIKANGYTYPIYLDQAGSVGAQLASRGIPTSYILDKQGRAIAGVIGGRAYDGKEAIELLRKLAEKLP
jgi:peroxiredoxin